MTQRLRHRIAADPATPALVASVAGSAAVLAGTLALPPVAVLAWTLLGVTAGYSISGSI